MSLSSLATILENFELKQQQKSMFKEFQERTTEPTSMELPKVFGDIRHSMTDYAWDIMVKEYASASGYSVTVGEEADVFVVTCDPERRFHVTLRRRNGARSTCSCHFPTRLLLLCRHITTVYAWLDSTLPVSEVGQRWGVKYVAEVLSAPTASHPPIFLADADAGTGAIPENKWMQLFASIDRVRAGSVSLCINFELIAVIN